METPLNFIFIGLPPVAGKNNHTSICRALIGELHRLGHGIRLLERESPWYAGDNFQTPWWSAQTYKDLEDLKCRFSEEVTAADAVIVGSCGPQGIEVGKWVTEIAQGTTAFYDFDTPTTLALLEKGGGPLSGDLVPRYDFYLSTTGGAAMEAMERRFGTQRVRPLYPSTDGDIFFPEETALEWEMGHWGPYDRGRQSHLEKLLFEPARTLRDRQFLVVGEQYPENILWPVNVFHVNHLPADSHRRFYNSQRFTLHIARGDHVHGPDVQFFQATACASPIITTPWEGLSDFFEPGREVLVARNTKEVLEILNDLPEEERRHIGHRARARFLLSHTPDHRAQELISYVKEPLSTGEVLFGLSPRHPTPENRMPL